MNVRLNGEIVREGKSALALRLNRDIEFVKRLMSELMTFYFREKIRGETFSLPYRKPTLVGESRRLRRSGEGSSRNSAKKLDVIL